MGIIQAAIGYLGLVIVFDLQVLLPQIIGGLLAELPSILTGPKKRRKTSPVTNQTDSLTTTDAEDRKPASLKAVNPTSPSLQ